MEYFKKIKVTGENWAEIFALPCVMRINKGVNDLGDYAYLFGGLYFAYKGDEIVQKLDGTWEVHTAPKNRLTRTKKASRR